MLVIMSNNNARIGWVVEYLVRVRHGNLANIGYVPAGSYGGLFLGRLLLAEPTHRFGERRMLLLYACICLALQLVFWLVPNLVSSIVVFAVMGFFLGPFFAAVSHHPQSNSLV
jgi:fucose permease